MTPYRRSFWKTIGAATLGVVAFVGGAAGLAAEALTAGASWPALAWAEWSGAELLLLGSIGWLTLVIAGGWIALRRDTLEERGIPYARTERPEWVPGPIARATRRALRHLASALRRGPPVLGLLPGDPIEVKSLDEVLATLDDRGTLDGLPFMPEMVPFCGQRLRVLRRVEKIYDWVWHTGLRRLRDTVLLEGLRCDGGGHGGCQAMCCLLWKEAWLRRPSTVAPAVATGPPRLREADLVRLASRVESNQPRYRCQLTELKEATTPLAWGDPRHYLRDLLWGNVRLRPFLVGIALRTFAWVQRKRGGTLFPIRAPAGLATTPLQVLDLQPGELVRVKPKRDIEQTLNERSRNRGLFFDADMHRFCGGTYRVLVRVERILEEQTGRMLILPNACIGLDGVTATGEYLAFCPQSEFIFWREIWLEPVPSTR